MTTNEKASPNFWLLVLTSTEVIPECILWHFLVFFEKPTWSSPLYQMCCCPSVSISDCFSSSDGFRGLQRQRLCPAPRGGRHRCKTAAALSETIDTFQRHIYWWACLCGCVRPSWADCVSRTKRWGCRRRSCSSCTERRYSCGLCACVLLSLCGYAVISFVLCGSTLWRRRCCPPVRSWVNRATPVQQPRRAWSSRETCCKMGCSAPAGSCPESALWARSHTSKCSHTSPPTRSDVYAWRTATVWWNRTAEYLLRVSQWTPRLLMESKNQLFLALLWYMLVRLLISFSLINTRQTQIYISLQQ